MSSVEQIERLRRGVNIAFSRLITDIGAIQIGSARTFPFGWRKAAKGRTVWRILEEAIVQNLEADPQRYGLAAVLPCDSEVGIFDLMISWPDHDDFAYVNIKSAVKGGRINKDDISKAKGLIAFQQADPDAVLFIVTIEITFNKDMSVALENVYVMPTAWLPDLYVNPSNNGNLQSSKYKDIDNATHRSTEEFLAALIAANEIASGKRLAKLG
jgi:hypothetical protein